MKSKDEVVMHAGFRRFSARPIYSEIPRSHRIEVENACDMVVVALVCKLEKAR